MTCLLCCLSWRPVSALALLEICCKLTISFIDSRRRLIQWSPEDENSHHHLLETISSAIFTRPDETCDHRIDPPCLSTTPHSELEVPDSESRKLGSVLNGRLHSKDLCFSFTFGTVVATREAGNASRANDHAHPVIDLKAI